MIMDYSASNTEFWKVVLQLGYIAVGLLISNLLRRKVPFVKKGLVPTAVIAGFIFLILKTSGLMELDASLLERLTYHGIAIGFIALSLRIPKVKQPGDALVGAKSGALIVSTYLLQGLIGLVVTIVLAYTFMPGLFKASGLLLPMGYGQGPGQANNIGSTYEALGFTGGRSFGLALAAAGYICACVVGVIYLNILAKKRKIKRGNYDEMAENATVDMFQDKGEIPISESVDRLSVQAALVMTVYLATFLVTWGITSLLESVAPGAATSISPLLWGFNFIIGSMLAVLTRVLFQTFTKKKIMTRQYQNNHLLSRISGFAFDIMIIAGIASINIEDLSGLWVPFIILAVLGGVLTLVYLRIICKKIYPNYYYEGLISMYGMLTGTISSGVLLLREIDADLQTPAANNLVLGSSYGILFGIPMLIFVSLATKSTSLLFITLGAVVVYLIFLLIFIYKAKPKKIKE